ncbi:MAG: glycerate kinase [Clostridia bacterium]
MKKVVLIPDSFKGTMSSAEICDITENALRKHFDNLDIVKIPVADGGEGSVDCFLQAVGGRKVFVKAVDPFFNEIEIFYGLIENDSVAIVEMAACAGLPLVDENKNPKKATTFGVGQLILDAIQHGVKKIIVGLGGSATNDGGAGFVSALGVKFQNLNGEFFVPTGDTLSQIAKIDISQLKKNIDGIEFVTMCDIDNPLFGKNGAAYVFAKQKGANDNCIALLDDNLRCFADVVAREIGFSDSSFCGAGAAGGMGFSMKAFLNSKMQMGIETVLDTVNFDAIAKDADYIFSGEGKIDSQSLRGKVVLGVAKRAKALNVPLIAVVGDIGDDIEPCYENGVTAIFSINRVAVPFKEAKLRAKSDLALTIENVGRFIKTTEKA